MKMILFDVTDLAGIQAARLLVSHHYAMNEGRPYNPECYCGTCEAWGKKIGNELAEVAGGMEMATEKMFAFLNSISVNGIQCGDWQEAERFLSVWMQAYMTTSLEDTPAEGNA